MNHYIASVVPANTGLHFETETLQLSYSQSNTFLSNWKTVGYTSEGNATPLRSQITESLNGYNRCMSLQNICFLNRSIPGVYTQDCSVRIQLCSWSENMRYINERHPSL